MVTSNFEDYTCEARALLLVGRRAIFTIVLELGMVFTLTLNIGAISTVNHPSNHHQNACQIHAPQDGFFFRIYCVPIKSP
jgi:hypothetical protein